MVRTRRFFLLKVSDYWFDADAFINSTSPISILHSNKELDKIRFSVKLNSKTFHLDLSPTTQEIFEAFEPKSARYPIRKAERDGVIVKKAETDKERNDFFLFFKEFADKKQFPLIKADELNSYDVFYALSSSGEFLGGLAFVKSPDRSVYRYKHGATSYKYNENDLLLWTAIRYAKEAGYSIFDFGGVTPTYDEKSYYFRQYKFKAKFGGDLVDFYTYIKIRRPFSLLMFVPDVIVRLFFKRDYNGFTNFLDKMNFLK